MDKVKVDIYTEEDGIEKINIENINKKKMREILFIYNALENGWEIKKNKESYIFRKKHNNKKEIFDNNYLTKFVEENVKIRNIIDKL